MKPINANIRSTLRTVGGVGLAAAACLLFALFLNVSVPTPARAADPGSFSPDFKPWCEAHGGHFPGKRNQSYTELRRPLGSLDDPEDNGHDHMRQTSTDVRG